MTYQGGSTLPPDLLERLAIEGFESKTVKTCLRRLRLRFSNLAKVASIVRVKAPDCPTAETYLANCPVFDVYLHRALGQAGEHGAGRRVGNAPVAGASVLISLGIVDVGFGDYAAARTRIEHGLAIAREIDHPLGMADALTNLGCVYRILGEYSTAQSHLEKALQVYQEHGCSVWETDVQCALAENALYQGDLATARTHLQTASNRLGTFENKWLQALVCYFRGLLAHYEGDGVEAIKLLGKATALAREGQYKPDLARSLVTLGRVKRTLGQLLPASELLMDGLDLFRALGHKLGITNALEELGAVKVVQGDDAQATMLFSTAHALREGMGAPLPPVDRPAYDTVLAACRARLGETAFIETWAHAAARPFQEVVEESLKLR